MASKQVENVQEVENVVPNEHSRAEDLISATPKRKLISYIWDSLDKSPEERRLVFKLDCALLTFACLGYFIKLLDQSNINNAFVSGMKEDLSLYGNQLNYMQTLWSVGYVLGGATSNIILTRVRPSYFVPVIEICWSVLTMVTAKCNTAEQIYAVRFFIGLFESALFPGMIYVIGSWYRSDELAKRTCLFQMSNAIGTMFSGYLMAAVYHLGGVNGLKGWQWLFIVDGIISLPIAVAGFFMLPDLPENTRAWYLTKDEILMAKRRVALEGRAQSSPITLAKLKKIFTGWHWWCLVPLYVCWNNGGAAGQPVFQQFLKYSTDPVYNVTQINTYPTTVQGLQIFCTIFFAWTSDSVLKGRRWPSIIVGGIFNIICYASLWAWDINITWKWASMILMGVGAALAGIIMSWAHEICTHDNEERAIVTGAMNQMSYFFQIWIPLLVWQQIDAPRYMKGYIFVLWLSVAMIALTLITLWYEKRDKRRDLQRENDQESSSQSDISTEGAVPTKLE